MNKISCDICGDLVPLVKDGIASEDSCNAVLKHTNECEACNLLFNEFEEISEINKENIKMNDKKVISKIKNQLVIGAMVMIILGSFIGVEISESEWMFYNIIIMPIVGGLGYFAFNKKSYMVPIGIFILTYIWNLIKYIIEGVITAKDMSSIIVVPATWAVIYTGLCALGVLIGFLLYIAFKKENK
ncbi:zf-HC2 domain-containing protein [Terrisporobacter petrolearius]|uniref:zf-HC2 domain-containing protein n=1 Tax=Terrisporobacter petrolearius TaxID=1460447 RepID=UPI003B00E392